MRKYLRYLGILIVFFSSTPGADAQTIASAGTPAALSTTYGSASASTSFSVSGTGLTAGILVTAPAGFLVSLNNATYSGTVTVGAAGTVASTTVYVELGPTAAAGNFSGNIALSSAGATNVSIAIPASTIAPAPLTITASNANKTYGTAITGGPGSTAFAATGLQNGESIGSVTIFYSSGSAATDQIGTYMGCVIASGATGGTFNPANYVISYLPGEIVVAPVVLTISVNNVDKTYGATITGGAGSTAFTATGLQNGETISSVTIAYGPGAASTDGIGTYIGCVSVSGAIGTNFTPSNYIINYIAANIIVTPAALTVKLSNVNKTYGAAITGGPGSTAFTAAGLQNGETITLTISYSTGSAATDPIGTYLGCVTASGATGANFAPANYVITYIPGNIIVSPAILTVTANNVNKSYGAAITGAPGSTAFSSAGLQNGETIGTVTIFYSTGSAATDAPGTYLGCVIASGATGGTFNATNYTINYLPGNIIVVPAVLTITANNVSKQYGTTLFGAAGSTAFTASGLQNGETIGSITITYGSGSASADAAGTYAGSVVASLATGGTFTAFNYSIIYVPGNIIVVQPTIVISTGSLNALSTQYGTASAATSFDVSGMALNQGILITPPAGFEVSIDDNTFSGSITAGGAGAVAATTVYARLAGTTPAGNYSGNIVLSSAGAADVDEYLPSGVVVPAPLTITADNQTRVYGENNPVFAVTYSGFVNNEGPAQLSSQPLLTTPATILSAPGQYPIDVSGAVSSNYTFTYVPGVLTVEPTNQPLKIPNAFSPNGDGINDTWNIQDIGSFPNCSVSIFNRAGKVVYSSIGYGMPWDGTSKGSALPMGTYYYVIDLKTGRKPLSGYVAIVK